MKALHIAATGMKAQELNVEVISNNVANMRTTGYKRQRADFQDLLYQNLRRMGTNSSANGTIVPTGVQIGSGVKTASTARIMSQGNLSQTGKELDVAVRGEGFFQIQLPDGGEAYTRRGDLSLTATGLLVTGEGHPVLGDTGPITVPPGGRISISEDGTVTRTDPDAPKHKGISVLLIPTDLEGVVCRPFADMCGIDNLDFNEVFFTDVRVPAENLVGPLNGGWGVANGSLGHERTMMWLGFADRIANAIADFEATGPLERDALATSIMDYEALRLLGSVGIAKAARGEVDVASVSIPKLLGAEAEQRVEGLALEASGPDGLIHPATSGPYAHMNLDHYFASWFERYARSFGGTIAGGTSEIQRNIIAQQVLGLPRR